MSLEQIKELSAYNLAAMADCLSPDDMESPGAKMLVRVRDNVVEAIKNGSITLDDFDDNGQLHEISDNAPSVYTHELWSQFVDLGAYLEDPEMGEWPDDLNRVAGIALYQIADRLGHAICERWRDEWQCPTCGEGVDPHGMCDQDTCGNVDDNQDDECGDHCGTECAYVEDEADQDTPADDVITGPVDLDQVADRDRRQAEEAQIQAETDSDMRRMDALRIGHEIEVRAHRWMVATVTAILAVVGIVTTVAVMS